MADRRKYPAWARLAEGLRTGKPQNEAIAGQELFSIYDEPAAVKGFVDAMTGLQLPNIALLSTRVDFSAYRTLCDVGGSGAELSMTIARRHPRIHWVSLDLPPVSAIAERHMAGAGLAGRVEVVSGISCRTPYRTRTSS